MRLSGNRNNREGCGGKGKAGKVQNLLTAREKMPLQTDERAHELYRII